MPATTRALKIRPAIADDIPLILALDRSSSSAAHWTESRYRDLLTAAGIQNLLLVAEAAPETASDQAFAGRTSLLAFLVARHIPPEWELENIVVAPSSRQKGVGRQLLQALLDAAIQTNSSAVFLEVRLSNAAARGLYEKAGFREFGRRKSYYNDPQEDAVLYRFERL